MEVTVACAFQRMKIVEKFVPVFTRWKARATLVSTRFTLTGTTGEQILSSGLRSFPNPA
jgi:hypothetical protein